MVDEATKVTHKKRGKPSKPVDTSWHARFLDLLGTSCNVTLSCKGAGVAPKTAYEHKKEMPEFAEQWEEAKEAAIEILEAEAWLRAQKQSDLLMIFLLKAHKPEKYRERTELDVTSGGKPLHEALASALDKAYGKGK
jgi:hypothetical protein